MELQLVSLEVPDGCNLILGQSHFIKTVEDLYEAMVNSVPGIRFGIAFCEASGDCLIRHDGNDEDLVQACIQNARNLAAGHSFVVLIKEAFPVNVLPAVRQCPELVTLFCATANPVQAVVASSGAGRGILGVIDGSSPLGVEDESGRAHRHGFLRKIGYKR